MAVVQPGPISNGAVSSGPISSGGGTSGVNASANITGVQATSGVGTLGSQASAFSIVGVQGISQAGNLLTQSGPNTGTGVLTGVQGLSHAGTVSKTIAPQLIGVQAIGQAGQPTVLIFAAGFSMSDLTVITIPSMESDTSVSMRVSFDKGATFGNARLQSMGQTGQYYTNLQWRRLGYGRSIVVSLDWSSPRPTALANLYIQTSIEET